MKIRRLKAKNENERVVRDVFATVQEAALDMHARLEVTGDQPKALVDVLWSIQQVLARVSDEMEAEHKAIVEKLREGRDRKAG